MLCAAGEVAPAAGRSGGAVLLKDVYGLGTEAEVGVALGGQGGESSLPHFAGTCMPCPRLMNFSPLCQRGADGVVLMSLRFSLAIAADFLPNITRYPKRAATSAIGE